MVYSKITKKRRLQRFLTSRNGDFEEVGELISSSEHYMLYVSVEMVHGSHKYAHILWVHLKLMSSLKKKKFCFSFVWWQLWNKLIFLGQDCSAVK